MLCFRLLSLFFTPTICRLTLGLPHFLYLNPFTLVLILILYCYIADLPYHCTIQSFFDPLVQYHLIQVRLSLVDAHLPLHSLTLSLVQCSSI